MSLENGNILDFHPGKHIPVSSTNFGFITEKLHIDKMFTPISNYLTTFQLDHLFECCNTFL